MKPRRKPVVNLTTIVDELAVVTSTAAVCAGAAADAEHDDLALALLHGVLRPLRALVERLEGKAVAS